jgi:MYXO-CTERM domain-containing protein
MADLGYPGSCQADGACDGARACRKYAKSGTACGDTTCSSALGAVTGKLCNGTGGCEQNTLPCAPYVCGTSACTTTCKADADCDISGYCLNGTCAVAKGLAGACNNNDECASGFCADGECCNTACDGQCEACGAKGKCAPVRGAPVGNRKACDGDPKECGGSCDGIDAVECKYASTKEVCGQTCDSAKGQASQSTCDGKGACGKPMTSSCGAYACGDTACLLACTADTDCADAYECSDGECVPKTTAASCSTDLSTSTPQKTMMPVPCTPYICESSSGICRTTCTTIDDCASGYICDSNKSCVPSAAEKSSSSSGCGCRVGAGAPSGAGVGAILLLGLSSLRRRRRPRARVASLDERAAK